MAVSYTHLDVYKRQAEAASYGPLTYMYGPEPAQVKGEGFLFADTYDIPKDYTAKQLCDLMYDHTDKMLSPEIRREAAEKKMSLHDMMTIASMVEKEAKFRDCLLYTSRCV